MWSSYTERTQENSMDERTPILGPFLTNFGLFWMGFGISWLFMRNALVESTPELRLYMWELSAWDFGISSSS